ncbi:hypothetical protein FRC11_006685, partial [Ceratobasidium sp. 423]
MPGPSSPARKAKNNKAKEKAKIQGCNVKKGYEPDLDSIVRRLSHALTPSMKSWWDDHGGLKEFKANKGKRGGQWGAMAWIRGLYVAEWWEKFFPEAKEASQNERAWFFKVSNQGKLIWAHLDNQKRNPGNQPNEDDKEENPEVKKVKILQRAVAHDAFRREHPEEYDKEVEEWLKDRPPKSEPNVTERRKLSYAAYKKLSNQKKREWKAKAVAAVKESRKVAKITDPKGLTRFNQKFFGSLRELLKEGFEMGGIEVCALVVHQTEEGKTRVTRKLSEGIQGFSNSTGLAKSMDALKEYLEAVN